MAGSLKVDTRDLREAKVLLEELASKGFRSTLKTCEIFQRMSGMTER